MQHPLSQKKNQVPKYIYFCDMCEVRFEVQHSFSETCTDCIKCGEKNSLERKPTEFTLAKKESKFMEDFEVGSVVREAIREAREDLQIEKQTHKNKVYKKT